MILFLTSVAVLLGIIIVSGFAIDPMKLHRKKQQLGRLINRRKATELANLGDDRRFQNLLANQSLESVTKRFNTRFQELPALGTM